MSTKAVNQALGIEGPTHTPTDPTGHCPTEALKELLKTYNTKKKQWWVPTDTQCEYFWMVAQRCGLDPFAKQIFGINRGGKISPETSIQGLRLVAERTGRYAGQASIQWHTGERWVDVWLTENWPKAAKASVHKTGFDQPTTMTAVWAETYGDNPSPIARRMPSHMLGIRAEAHALRKAFPHETSGLYLPEEMDEGAGDIHEVPAWSLLEERARRVVEELPPAKDLLSAARADNTWPARILEYTPAQLNELTELLDSIESGDLPVPDDPADVAPEAGSQPDFEVPDGEPFDLEPDNGSSVPDLMQALEDSVEAAKQARKQRSTPLTTTDPIEGS